MLRVCCCYGTRQYRRRCANARDYILVEETNRQTQFKPETIAALESPILPLTSLARVAEVDRGVVVAIGFLVVPGNRC